MKHTIIDIRQDGPHVVPDPHTTLVQAPAVDLLSRAGAPVTVIDPTAHLAGVAAGLGAFYDALVVKGFDPATAQSLLWAAYENVKSRSSAGLS